jgi:hypothetical protein
MEKYKNHFFLFREIRFEKKEGEGRDREMVEEGKS